MYELKDYLNAINYTKEKLLDSEDEMWEKKYAPFIVNKVQFDFLLNSIRPRKRFTKWAKAKKIKDIEYVKEYYGYSNEKAKSALDILDDEQLETIKRSLNKGGRNGR